jgi:hypothetical protein
VLRNTFACYPISEKLPWFNKHLFKLIKVQLQMNKIYFSHKIYVLTIAITLSCFIATAQSFTAGNLAVFTASASANNTTGTIVEFSTTGTGVVSHAIPDGASVANGLRFSGSATSTGYLANSNDGSLLAFTGANSNNTALNVNTLNPRAVGSVNNAGTYALPTIYTGTSGNQTRCATSINNTNWFIADQGGVYTNGTSAASPTGNLRGIKSFAGIVYVGQQSPTAIQVATVSAPTGGTITALPGLSFNNAFQDFYLISSGYNGNSYDVLYIISNTSATAGTITKFSLVAGNWTANGSYATTFGGFGMAAKKSGAGADIFVSTGNGATLANSVIKLNDAAGYNAAINITTASNVILYTTTALTIIKGVAFAPVTVATNPSVNLSVSSNTGTEAAQTVITVTATSSSAVTGNQTVSLAVTGTNITAGDYTLSNTTINIPDGSTTGTVTFTVVDDAVIESTETAVLTISSPSAGISLGSTITQNIDIIDNEIPNPVNLSVSSNAGDEASSTLITVTATAQTAVTGNQSIDITVGGSGITLYDYILPGTSIKIPDSTTTGTTTFKIRRDAETEGTETAVLTILNPSSGISLGTTTSQAITITDFTCLPLIRKSTATSTNGAQISAFDVSSKRIYTVGGPAVEYYNVSNTGVVTGPVNVPFGFTSPGNNIIPNSVTIKNGIAAVGYSIKDPVSNAQQLGVVGFYNASTAAYLNRVTVGYQPDMITFSPDGTKVLSANEGEPNSYGQGNSFDPEGSVSIIDISGGVAAATVTNAGFTSFNPQIATLQAAGVRIFGPGATVAQDLEPEYIAFSADGLKAYVALQENNAVAEVDIPTATVLQIFPLDLKDHDAMGFGLDASDKDSTATSGKINIQNWPIYGMYQPDGIAGFTVNGNSYYITANEGDSRGYTGYTEDVRAGSVSYVLDPTIFPNAAMLKLDENLGRLHVSTATGDTNNDGLFDEIHAFGSRSFSIWNNTFSQIFDSGDQLEQTIASELPGRFNADYTNNTFSTFDTRSDSRGPEPESVTTGTVDGVLYAFVGMERSADIMVYDISNPNNPVFKQFIDNPADLGVEGLLFVPAYESPTGKALIIASAEVSKTVTIYEFNLIPGTLPVAYSSINSTQGVTTFYGDCNGLIAKINQNGANPISGDVNARVWVEATVPLEGGEPFVQRHYEITPVTNAATATAKVTLYFTQAEFDNFNNDPTSALNLPTGPTDAAGIANLRVGKYPGVSNDGSGLPYSYTTGTPIVINPADNDIVWNSIESRWEVSFDVAGFSGFIIQTSKFVLPVTLLSFNATEKGNDALLQWKVANEIDHAFYEILYSVDGRNFISAGQRIAQNGSGEKNYSFTHINAATIANKIFYRLKMVSTTGAFTYSNIVPVRFGVKGQMITDVYPNPAKDRINVVTTSTSANPVSLRIADMSGRIMMTKLITAAGLNNIDISSFAPGLYILSAILPDGSKQQFKIIKE